MVIFISIASIPIFIFIGIIFWVMSEPEAQKQRTAGVWIVGGFQYILSLCAFAFCFGGTLKFLNDMGLYKDEGLFALTIPAFCLYAFGLACWASGRVKGRSEAKTKYEE
jgi:hypothetical protein